MSKKGGFKPGITSKGFGPVTVGLTIKKRVERERKKIYNPHLTWAVGSPRRGPAGRHSHAPANLGIKMNCGFLVILS